MAAATFTSEFTVRVHGSTSINAVYTNDVDSVDAWIGKVEGSLAAAEHKIVGADVEYTTRVYSRSKGYIQKAAVIQLCVGQECLVYHLSCVPDGISAKFVEFLRNKRYRFFIFFPSVLLLSPLCTFGTGLRVLFYIFLKFLPIIVLNFFLIYHCRFAGFDIPKDKKMLYYSEPPLFIMNYNDIHAYWMNPDNTSRRKQKITDVAVVLIDSSYKDGDEMTVDDHRKWGVAPLSQKHLDYAAKNAFLSYELYRMLDFYERGFFRRLYKKPVSPDETVRWAWGSY